MALTLFWKRAANIYEVYNILRQLILVYFSHAFTHARTMRTLRADLLLPHRWFVGWRSTTSFHNKISPTSHCHNLGMSSVLRLTTRMHYHTVLQWQHNICIFFYFILMKREQIIGNERGRGGGERKWYGLGRFECELYSAGSFNSVFLCLLIAWLMSF